MQITYKQMTDALGTLNDDPNKPKEADAILTIVAGVLERLDSIAEDLKVLGEHARRT